MQELDGWEPKGNHSIPFGMYSCGVEVRLLAGSKCSLLPMGARESCQVSGASMLSQAAEEVRMDPALLGMS